MSDLVFTAATVEAAVTQAAETLGLPPARVRYVVLQDVVPTVGRTPPPPAKIVVLVEQPQRPTSPEPPAADAAPRTLEATVAALAAVLSRAAGEEATLSVAEQGDSVSIEMGSPSGRTLWEGDPVLLDALDLLLRRIAGVDGRGRRIHIVAQGQGDPRETALRQSALATAEAVLADGAARPLDRLNSFERRIVHMTLANLPGIRTRSDGDGAARRLWIETAPTRDA